MGYLLAFASCLLWSCYIIMTRKYANITSEMMGMYLGVGALFALGYHVTFETFITPTHTEYLLLACKGLLTLSASYFCWDFAIKRGNFALLNVLSYFNPIITLLFLSLLGIATSKAMLWLGALLIAIAAVLCSGVLNKKASFKTKS